MSIETIEQLARMISCPVEDIVLTEVISLIDELEYEIEETTVPFIRERRQQQVQSLKQKTIDAGYSYYA